MKDFNSCSVIILHKCHMEQVKLCLDPTSLKRSGTERSRGEKKEHFILLSELLCFQSLRELAFSFLEEV